MNRDKFIRSIIFFSLFLLGLLSNILLHEFGHCLPAIAKGGGINRIVALGYEIIPNFGMKTHFGFTSAFSNVNWPGGYYPPEFWKGLEKFSGSGFTLLLSFISVVLLWLIKPKRVVKYLLLVLSFGFLDIFTFTFLPLLGLPHRLFVGSIYSEPVVGMMLMGFSKTFSSLLILSCGSVIIYFLLTYYRRVRQKEIINETI